MARTNNLTDFLTDVAGAIKEKKEYPEGTKIAAADFDSEIASIETGTKLPEGIFIQEDLPETGTNPAIWLKQTNTEDIKFLDSIPSNILDLGFRGLIQSLPQSSADAINSSKYILLFNIAFGGSSPVIFTTTSPLFMRVDTSSMFAIEGQNMKYFNPTHLYGESTLYAAGNGLIQDSYGSILWSNSDILNEAKSQVKYRANLIPEDKEEGVNIVIDNVRTTLYHKSGITGNPQKLLDTSKADATSNDILEGKTAFVNNTKLTGTMVNNGELVYTPTTEEQTIPAGYTSGGIIGAAVISEDDYDDCVNLAKDIFGRSIGPELVDGMVSRYLASSYTSGTSWVDEISRKTGTVNTTGVTKVDNYLHIIDSHATTADINMYKGTFEICCRIPTTFTPRDASTWYTCSCILGKELSWEQKDFGMVINSSGYLSIGYSLNSIQASTFKVNDSQLHTLTITYDESTYRLYADGVLLTSVNHTVSGETPTELGIFWNSSSEGNTNVTGDIFDVRFYDKVLTAEELATNHAYDEFYYGGDN